MRDLPDGETVETILLVKESALAQRRNGEDFLRLKLCDCTGTLEAVAWDGVAEVHEIAQPGIALRVRGRYEVSQRYGPQLTLKSASLAQAGDYRLADLMDGPAAGADQMEADLRRLIETVRNPWLRQLLDALIGAGSPVWERFRRAPAAKYYHQAYLHGLLEHSLSVGQAVSAVSGAFPGVDRDLAVTGGLIHDIGKIEAYDSDPVAIDLSDEGKLLGEIPLGYYMVRTTIERIEGFPPELARAVLHIVLSHHGALENGSPVVPCTREATVVHAIDNLGGKLGSFDRLEKGLQDGATWSRFDRALSGAAYFGRTPEQARTGARARAGSAARRRGRVGARLKHSPGPADGGWEESRAPLGMSTAKDHKLGIIVVALLAGASVRLDEIYYRKPVLEELWPDWLIGLILAFAATVVLIGTRRLLESRDQISELARRTSGLADAAWIVSRGGQTDSILAQVAEQACSIVGVERATVCVRDRNDPRSSIVVAGHGINAEPDRPATRDRRGHRGPGVPLRRAGDRLRLPRLSRELRWRSGPQTRAGGSAPIRYQGEVRGALVDRHRRSRTRLRPPRAGFAAAARRHGLDGAGAGRDAQAPGAGRRLRRRGAHRGDRHARPLHVAPLQERDGAGRQGRRSGWALTRRRSPSSPSPRACTTSARSASPTPSC